MRKEGRGVFKSHTESTEAQRFIVHRGELTLAGGHRDRVGEWKGGAEWSERSHTEGTEGTEMFSSQRRADARGRTQSN